MEKYVGGADKIGRIVLGLALLSLFYFLDGSNAKYFGLIGIVPLGTAFLGFCPLYPMMKINTLKKKLGGK